MKPLAPEIAALIPDGIEKFVPSCIVCRKPVPLHRARGRSKDTCSPECGKVRALYRRYVLSTSKCVSCLHPSSPQEREDFKQWRRDRRQLKKKGRPKGKKTLDNVSSLSATP